ncbi:MAG TPA: tRNA 2-thiouridine(34) synthase MnmA [Candidatus Onthocola gallistercoris]|uniref:tRNA-specific 2-thiouridylase MnmA n=1 Tax=Candidatus Onthocola gallistercoris TaxID=2840876 RepID=A0A9D1KW73_9FIRM|nr:tRNA 2-thiouridine(34) synthase MnmA [Candidatus Onthocola gallistercoris]
MAAKKVVVGMSGGVDSSVAAWLLKEQGYDVIGITMQIWQDEDTFKEEEQGGCCGLSAVDDARRVAAKLDIPYYVMNFKDIFRKEVIDDFVREYFAGRTPNPCVRCNRYVKWEALLRRSLSIGADYIATGHYASVVCLPDGRYTLKKAPSRKDQTYALYNLTQDQLAHTLMPVGDYTKDEIRRMAEQAGLPVAHKADSQDICFIPDGDYQHFLEEYTGKRLPEGNFVDRFGHVLGRHKGITHYTVGQRKGLNLSMGRPVFVTAIHPETNEVVIGDGDEVFGNRLEAESVNWMGVVPLKPGESIHLTAKIRYAHEGEGCQVTMLENGRIQCLFDRPVRAITPGQAVVLYDGDLVAGGGVICSSTSDSTSVLIN